MPAGVNPPAEDGLLPGNPLWQRVPTRDASGRACIDFMLVIPGMKRCGAARKQARVVLLRDALAPFESSLVFVDFNQRLGLIWVSLKPVPGIARVVTVAIQQAIPEARLVASQCHPDPAAEARRVPLLERGRRMRRRLFGLLGR